MLRWVEKQLAGPKANEGENEGANDDVLMLIQIIMITHIVERARPFRIEVHTNAREYI